MEEQLVTIKVNAQAYNIIMGGLAKLPYEVSAQVIANLSEQIKAQVDAQPKESK
jgi:hypothetical protein